MVSARRLGRIGVVLLLGVALGVGTPGCSRKSSKKAAGKESAVKAGSELKSTHRAQPSAAPRVTPLPAAAPRGTPLPAGSRPSHATFDPGTASAGELYAHARAAWLAGECEKSIRFARLANRKKFSTRHVSIIGACACSLRRPKTAQWAYKILRGGQRNMLMVICRSKGIDLSAAVDNDPQPAPRPQRPVPPDPSDPPVSPVLVGPNTAATFYKRARSAWLAGQCSKAIRLAKRANKKKHSSRHWSIIGACSCSLRRRGEAKRALAVLRGGQRNMIIQICRSKGITLD